MNNIGKKILLLTCLIFLVSPLYVEAFHEEISIIRMTEFEQGVIKRVYLIKEDGLPSNLIQKIVNTGYKSNIAMYLRINFDNDRIDDFMITSHNESKNYASYIEKDWFQNRFLRKSANMKLELVKMAAEAPNEVVAVTGATISSKAIIEGVNEALNNYKIIKGGIINEKEN